MAIAKKCDRCGKLYEGYNSNDRSKMNGVVSCNINEKGTYMYIDVIDLCQECCEAFNKWLKDPSMMVIFPTSILGVKVDDDWMNKPQPDQYKITCDNSFMKSFEEDE